MYLKLNVQIKWTPISYVIFFYYSLALPSTVGRLLLNNNSHSLLLVSHKRGQVDKVYQTAV